MIHFNKYVIPYLIILLLIGYKGKLFLSLVIVLIHEIVHYYAARYFGFAGFDIEVLPIGTVLKLKDLDDALPKEDLIISLSAPLINLVLAVLFYVINNAYPNEIFLILYKSNLTIGAFNLIPAFPLDGGRILRDILSFKNLYKVSNKITVYVSLFIGSTFICYYIFLFFKGTNNFNLGLISIFIIVSSLKEKERIVYIIMADIIKKKYKFIKRGYIENRSISVHYKKDLISILGIVDKNKYNIFLVLDDSMKVIDVVYEEEIIEGLKNNGNITLEELLDIQDLIDE